MLLRQCVVRTPKGHARIQILAIHVPRECSRFTHQPVDHVPIVDAVLALAAQPRHRLHPRSRVPYLDLVRSDPRFHPLANQPRRHRVRILLDLDRAPLAHTHLLPLPRLQPLRRQTAQPPLLLGKFLLPPRVPSRHQRQHELPVGRAALEIPTATHQQRLLQFFLETPMPLFAIAVLVTAGRVGRLGSHSVMPQQRLVLSRILLHAPLVVHRQRHAVRAVSLRRSARRPQRVLQPHAQARETLRVAQAHVLPVRVRQHEMIDQMRKRLPLDGHSKARHVREVRRAHSTRFVPLAEEHFLGWTVLGTPLPHTPFQRPPRTLPVLTRVLTLQPLHQRLGLQPRFPLQQFFQTRPHLRQRVRPRSPRVRPWLRERSVPILACGLAIHARLHRCVLERCPFLQLLPQLLDLRRADLASCSHGNSFF
jgi:hypothetical protein